MPYQKEIKGIKLIQERTSSIQGAHNEISADLESLKQKLMSMEGADELLNSKEYKDLQVKNIKKLTSTELITDTSLPQIYAEAEARYAKSVGLSDILSVEDFAEAEKRIDQRILAFNQRYGLDGWDYAIAGSCGLFASMLDLLFVAAPMKPSTTRWETPVNGVFNKAVQAAFNKLIPPELSEALSKANPIGAPDSSTILHLIGAQPKTLNPFNHRLLSLAHDPLLGFIFGVIDMMNGTCTIAVNGIIESIPSTKAVTEGSIFQLLGRMLGHLVSDVNAPSKNGNRGMGLPAPFMGLLRMLECIPVPVKSSAANTSGWSNFGKQIEWMYVNGYDLRQFVVTSLPMAIMEVLLRAFYTAKQMKLYGAEFSETILDTMPGRLNPRFRMMLALAYGTSTAVNAGKMYITQNILNANYASWMGLAWNGFHALKWAVYNKHLKLWDEIESIEVTELERLVGDLDVLKNRAKQLPI